MASCTTGTPARKCSPAPASPPLDRGILLVWINMATAAKRPCNHPGCNLLLAYGQAYCEPHQKMRQQLSDSRRGSSNARGYGVAWQKARAGYLRNHPLCKAHQEQGLLVPSSVVDHIIPHKGDKTLFWDSSNWQPLCKRCHDIKTATQDGGFGR